MEKVYLLLRNNLQSGPFTIGELLQQQLKPTDMIWIEGKSTAWTYLSELELIPFSAKVPPPPKTEEMKGRDEIERKAEELRQKVLNTAPRHFPAIQIERETYASPYKLPEEEIRFIDHRKERKTILGELAITCVVIGLFGIGIYKGREILSDRKTVENSIATKLETNDQHAAQKNYPAVVPLSSAGMDSSHQRDSLTVTASVKPKTLRKRADSASINPEIVITTPTSEQSETTKETSADKVQAEDPQPVVKVPEEIPVKKDVNAAPKEIKNSEEKKGFLKGLFKKKKKDNNQ